MQNEKEELKTSMMIVTFIVLSVTTVVLSLFSYKQNIRIELLTDYVCEANTKAVEKEEELKGVKHALEDIQQMSDADSVIDIRQNCGMLFTSGEKVTPYQKFQYSNHKAMCDRLNDIEIFYNKDGDGFFIKDGIENIQAK